MELNELIVSYRKEHGLSQRQFAEQCNLSNGYISMIEKKKNPATGKPPVLSLPTLQKISAGMGLTTSELFSCVDDLPISLLPPGVSNISPVPDDAKKPRLGSIACGSPILADQNIDAYDAVPTWVDCDFTLLCKGDSMTGARIYDGDIVCIRLQPEVENGEIAAVLVDDEATLKRVYLAPGRLTLMPENPSYQPMVYVGSEINNIRIIGKATHFISAIR